MKYLLCASYCFECVIHIHLFKVLYIFFRLEIPLQSLKCDWSISKKYILRYEALYFLRN